MLMCFLVLINELIRGIRNLLTNFDVSWTFRSRFMGQHLSDAPSDIVTLTFDLAGDGLSRRYGSSSSICTPSLKFVGLSVRKIWRTSGLNIMSAWWHWPLPLTLELVRIIARGVDNLPTNFRVSRTYRPTPAGTVTWPCDLDLWPWRSRRLTTFTFDLLCHGTCRWCGSSCSVLRSEDIAHLLCEH